MGKETYLIPHPPLLYSIVSYSEKGGNRQVSESHLIQGPSFSPVVEAPESAMEKGFLYGRVLRYYKNYKSAPFS